jgi:hypothetical protein
MINDERKAVERARATLNTLTPATARDDAIAFDLRYASRHLAGAQAKSVSSEAALNVLRAAALNALSAVALVSPTHDFVSKARRYSTYPPSIQSELFYTDSEKFSAQSY